MIYTRIIIYTFAKIHSSLKLCVIKLWKQIWHKCKTTLIRGTKKSEILLTSTGRWLPLTFFSLLGIAGGSWCFTVSFTVSYLSGLPQLQRLVFFRILGLPNPFYPPQWITLHNKILLASTWLSCSLLNAKCVGLRIHQFVLTSLLSAQRLAGFKSRSPGHVRLRWLGVRGAGRCGLPSIAAC